MNDTRENTIKEIISLEWEMFQAVNNEGGRASCQDDFATFDIMRESQFSVLPDEVLDSYHDGLISAKAQGRNLVMEKYARMMASTAPDRYREIEPLLPLISEEHRENVEGCVRVHKAWTAEYAAQYPKISSRGRLLYTEQDTPYDTSVETYLRGELLTWPQDTVILYKEFLKECQRIGRNLVLDQELAIVKRYGFSSLEEANR